MIENFFSKVSIRGRAFYALICIEKLLSYKKIERSNAHELISQLFYFFLKGKNSNEYKWFEKLTTIEPNYFCYVFEHINEFDVVFEDITKFTIDPVKKLESKYTSGQYAIAFKYLDAVSINNYYKSIPKEILRCYQSAISLITDQCDEPAIIGNSQLTLDYLNEINNVFQELQIDLPPYKSFEKFSFSQNEGWGDFIIEPDL